MNSDVVGRRDSHRGFDHYGKKVSIMIFSLLTADGLLVIVFQLGKTATVVELQAKKLNSAVDLLGRYNDLNDILGKKTAMHVLASKPVFLSTADAGAEYIDSEKRVLKEQTKVEMLNKNRAVNDEMLEKIVAGKINKQLTEISLLSQPHANNPLMAAGEASEMTVEDVLSNYAKVHFNNEISLAIKSFHNWMLVK